MKNSWVAFKSDSVGDLELSFLRGAIIELAEEREDGSELAYIQKATFKRMNALRIFVYPNEHPPPHFHVEYNGLENSFNIDDASPLHPDGELKQFFKNVRKWHKQNKPELIAFWNQTRPVDCAVGSVKS